MSPRLLEKTIATFRSEGLGATARKAVRYGFKPLYVGSALRRLREESAGVDRADLFQFVRSFDDHGIDINAFQLDSEITAFLDLVAQDPPHTVLEIGTASGGTLFMLTRVAADDATIVSVDLPGGALGDMLITRSSSYPRWRSRLYRGFAREGQTMHVLRADSHAPSTLEDVRSRLGGRALDLLFIDGDHSYDGVKQDFELYSPHVAPGGLVAFHDIVPGGPGKHGDPGGVPDYWRELKASHPGAIELVEDWEWGSCGIGVIRR